MAWVKNLKAYIYTFIFHGKYKFFMRRIRQYQKSMSLGSSYMRIRVIHYNEIVWTPFCVIIHARRECVHDQLRFFFYMSSLLQTNQMDYQKWHILLAFTLLRQISGTVYNTKVNMMDIIYNFKGRNIFCDTVSCKWYAINI